MLGFGEDGEQRCKRNEDFETAYLTYLLPPSQYYVGEWNLVCGACNIDALHFKFQLRHLSRNNVPNKLEYPPNPLSGVFIGNLLGGGK